jgi:flagellar biosynthesis regulator FlaF
MENQIDTPEERRATELQAFARVTKRLYDAADGHVEGTSWRQALETNRVFWSVLKDNLFAADNRLTSDLKGQIFALATWVEGYTDKVLAGQARELSPLISVNDTIMQGLAA